MSPAAAAPAGAAPSTATGRPGIALDADGTIWSGDVGEDTFHAAVAADSTRQLPAGSAGIFRRQRSLTVSNLDQKIAIQEAGLAVGWLPLPRIQPQLREGRLVALEVEDTRQDVDLFLARHSEDKGKALTWFWERLANDEALLAWVTG